MKSLLLFSFFTIFIIGCTNSPKTPKKEYEKDYILCSSDNNSSCNCVSLEEVKN